MNQCEKVMLDSMVSLNMLRRVMSVDNQMERETVGKILLLLDCICEWRNPTETRVEDGCGKLVVGDE